jgi:hypothetical protein
LDHKCANSVTTGSAALFSRPSDRFPGNFLAELGDPPAKTVRLSREFELAGLQRHLDTVHFDRHVRVITIAHMPHDAVDTLESVGPVAGHVNSGINDFHVVPYGEVGDNGRFRRTVR